MDLRIDVTWAAGLGESVHTAATVVLPAVSDLPPIPIVCFSLPGAGFSRQYFTFDMPGSSVGGQAGWHARRGWIFVAIDHLGVGQSSLPDPSKLLYRNVSAANHATVTDILHRLAKGALAKDFPAIKNPVVLGIGQSMGGCLTIVQQASFNSYDGIGILGYSAVHTTTRAVPGSLPAQFNYMPRDVFPCADNMIPSERHPATLNSKLLEFTSNPVLYPNKTPTAEGWHYYFDDVPPDFVANALATTGEPPPWRSATMPGLVFWVVTPGTIAAEAASIVVPVLAAFAERDTLKDPRMECKAYPNAVDFSMFICPRMAHMHNFASTREVFWTRIHSWGEHVAELKRLLPDAWPSQLFSDSY